MPIANSRQVKDAKVIYISPDDIEGDDELLFLTDRQRDILLILSEYLDWKSRWKSDIAPFNDDDNRDLYVAELKRKLMEVVNFCEKMIECISTDTDTQDAIAALMANLIDNNQLVKDALARNAGHTHTPGQPLPGEYTGSNLVPGTANPDCSSTILKRQCRSIVEKIDIAIVDALDKFELATNAVELGEIFKETPLINYITNLIGYDFAISFLAYLQNNVREQYVGNQSEVYKDDLALLLYCYCDEDCEITIDRLNQFADDIMSDFDLGEVATVIETITTLLGINPTGTLIVDTMYWMVIKAMKYGNFLMLGVLDDSIQFIMRSAAMDATFDIEDDPACPVNPDFTVSKWKNYAADDLDTTFTARYGFIEVESFEVVDLFATVISNQFCLTFSKPVYLSSVELIDGSRTIGDINPSETFYDITDTEEGYLYSDATSGIPPLDLFENNPITRIYLQSKTQFKLKLMLNPVLPPETLP